MENFEILHVCISKSFIINDFYNLKIRKTIKILKNMEISYSFPKFIYFSRKNIKDSKFIKKFQQNNK